MTSAGERLAIRTVLAAARAIGFTGSRQGMTKAQQNALRSLLFSASGRLHHGDSVGADEQAHDIAASLDRKIVIHPSTLLYQRAYKVAKDIRLQKKPLIRNRDIVRETSALIAAPAESIEQLRSGTWSTVRHARKLKRPIVIIHPDGTLLLERVPEVGRRDHTQC
jgi:hypothetical protein